MLALSHLSSAILASGRGGFGGATSSSGPSVEASAGGDAVVAFGHGSCSWSSKGASAEQLLQT